ncbi:hypothetical protein AYI70_g2631 [Smittium culicis]|uniref:Uncharacterized protein n=1 Tax=Smittium culicis TaxID=133412 RepID=A0A1R1X0Q1_9FUNG|nr:hypothetical protein AYI70_g11685 [Smittium culicis]OMJ22806.1 hypothetical protein AYI70_g2631 [Smittium culicis]
MESIRLNRDITKGAFRQYLIDLSLYTFLLLLPTFSETFIRRSTLYIIKIKTLNFKIFSESFFDYDKYAKHYLGKTLPINKLNDNSFLYQKYLANFLTNINTSDIKNELINLADFDPYLKLKSPLLKLSHRNIPFEITLSSNSLSVDIMDIKVDSNLSIYGISESGSILCWSINSKDLSTKSLIIKKSSSYKKDDSDSSLVSESSSNSIHSTPDTAPKKIKPKQISWTKAHLNIFFFKNNIISKTLKLSNNTSLIKPGYLPLSKFTNDIYTFEHHLQKSNTFANINIDPRVTSSAIYFKDKSEIISKELVTRTEINHLGDYLAFITENGNLGIYSNLNKKISFIIEPYNEKFDYQSISSTANPNQSQSYQHGYFETTSFGDSFMKNHLFTSSKISFIKFAYSLTNPKSISIISEKQYFLIYSPEKNQNLKSIDSSHFSLVLLIGHENGHVSLFDFEKKSLYTLFYYAKFVGPVISIIIDSNTIYTGHSCGALSAINSSILIDSEKEPIDFTRIIKSKLSQLAVYNGKLSTYLLAGYSNGSILLYSKNDYFPDQKMCLQLKFVDIISGDSDLFKTLKTRSVHSNFSKRNDINVDSRFNSDITSSFDFSNSSYSPKLYESSQLNSDNMSYNWPPTDQNADGENNIFIKSISDDSESSCLTHNHTGRITRIITIPFNLNNKKQSNAVNPDSISQEDIFFVASSCSKDHVRIFKVELSPSKSSGDSNSDLVKLSSNIDLIFSFLQTGCRHIDFDHYSGTILGVKRVSNYQQFLSESVNTPNQSQNKSQSKQHNSNSSNNINGLDNKNQKKSFPKLSVHEQTSLRLSLLDIKHWVFALLRLIAIMILNTIKSLKIVTFLSKILKTFAKKYPQLEILFLLFSKEKITNRDNNHSKNIGNDENLFRATDSNDSSQDILGDLSTEQSSNNMWEIWTFNLGLWIESTKKELKQINNLQPIKSTEMVGSVEINNGKLISASIINQLPRSINFPIQIPLMNLRADSILPSNFLLSYPKKTDKIFNSSILCINHFPKVNMQQSIFSSENSTSIDNVVKNSMNSSDLFKLEPNSENTGFSNPLLSNSAFHFQTETRQNINLDKNHIYESGSNNYTTSLNNTNSSGSDSSCSSNINPFSIDKSVPTFSLPFGRVKDLKIIESRSEKSNALVVALACGNTIKLVSL